MSPVGAIFVPFPLKTGTNLLHPLPLSIVERVFRGNCEPPTQYIYIYINKKKKEKEKKNSREKQKQKQKNLVVVERETLFMRNSKLSYCPTKTCLSNTESLVIDVCNSNSNW